MDADTITTTDEADERRMAMKCTQEGAFSKRVRMAIAEHCNGRIDDKTVADAQLIASELVTNAFEHGARRGVVTLDLVLDGPALELTVTSTGSGAGIPHPSLWLLPETTERCGRGLALTRKISESVELHASVTTLHDEWTAISAHLASNDPPA